MIYNTNVVIKDHHKCQNTREVPWLISRYVMQWQQVANPSRRTH
jgi:hypothetical protein